MCCYRDKEIEEEVRNSADKKGWITAWKIVAIKDGHFRPLVAAEAPDYKKGENKLQPREKRRKNYSPYSPFGFHVYLDFDNAAEDWQDEIRHVDKDGGISLKPDSFRIVRVKAHIRSLITAGRWINGHERIGVFRRITISSFRHVRDPKTKRRKAG